jgi:acyl-CoA thioesterase
MEGDTGERFEWIRKSRSTPGTFYDFLGMKLEELRKGYSRFRLHADGRLHNAGGVVHGGVMASLADAAVAAALATLVDPERESIYTLEMKINYLAPAVEGDLLGEARIVQRGGTVAVGEARIQDEKGRQLALAIATFLIRKSEKGD